MALIAALHTSQRWKNSVYALTLRICGLNIKLNGNPDNLRKHSVLVYNHVSLIDAIAIATLENATIVAADPSANESSFNKYFFGDIVKAFGRKIFIIKNLRTLIRDIQSWKQSDTSEILCVAPEGTISNGRSLFRFEKFFFSLDTEVVPVALSVSPALPINMHPLGSHHAANIFWAFAMPYVGIRIDILDAVHKNDDETSLDFADRVRSNIAQKLGANVSEYSNLDKARWKSALKLYRAVLSKT